MNNKLLLGLFVCLGFFLNQNINAQYNNAVKINTSSLTYERAITGNSTINLSLSYSGVGSVNRLLRANDPITIDFSDRTVTLGTDIGGSSLGAELQYRFYTSEDKDNLSGFYVAPYVSFNRSKFKDVTGTDDLTGETFSYEAEFDATRISFGALIGTQWLLGEKERFVIDFNYFGLGFSPWTLNGSYTSSDPGIDYTEQKSDIENEIRLLGEEAIPFVSNSLGDIERYEIDAQTNGLDIAFKAGLPRLRFGLSIGYAF